MRRRENGVVFILEREKAMKTPILETERIILRPPTVTDAQVAFDNWTSDLEVAKYMRWNVHESVETTIEWLTHDEKQINDDKSYHWFFTLKETSETFGSGGFFWNDEHEMFEIGYCIMKKHWSKGLVTEASRVMIDFMVSEVKQTKLCVKHAKENIGSQRVIEKLGFVYQKDGEYPSLDGKRIFESRDYILSLI
jgi:ribosomal-protein-alanine N-acetyltransferase